MGEVIVYTCQALFTRGCRKRCPGRHSWSVLSAIITVQLKRDDAYNPKTLQYHYQKDVHSHFPEPTFIVLPAYFNRCRHPLIDADYSSPLQLYNELVSTLSSIYYESLINCHSGLLKNVYMHLSKCEENYVFKY